MATDVPRLTPVDRDLIRAHELSLAFAQVDRLRADIALLEADQAPETIAAKRAAATLEASDLEDAF